MELPIDFKERMKALLGDGYEAFIKSYDEEKKTGLRVNGLKTSKERFELVSPFKLSEIPWCKDGFIIEEAEEKPGRYALHDAGAYYIQEPSAMAVAASAPVKPGMKVLDLCAAPGGKSTQIASLLKGEGLLVSNEIHPARAKILSQNIERMGVRNAVVLNETPDRIADCFGDYFDVVFVDAPCSGEGMFRKDETAVSEWSPANVEMCAGRQREILKEAVRTVKAGGYLVYSTCTFAPSEDEEQVADLIYEYPEFSVCECDNFKYFDKGRPEWITGDYPEEIKNEVTKAARLWPHLINGEGHFVCIFRKTGESEDKTYKNKSQKGAGKAAAKAIEDFAKENLVDFKFNSEDIILLDESLLIKPSALDISINKLHVVRLGLNMGIVKKDRIEPSHSLAMALGKESVIRSVELTKEEATAYRHGEEIRRETQNGWTLMCYEGVSLGWGKASNNVIKNHYPKGLRINY